MPLPLISAAPPSALTRFIVQSAPSALAPMVMRPSAPMPRWRSHSAATLAAVIFGRAGFEREPNEKVVPGRVQLRELHSGHERDSIGAGTTGDDHRAITEAATEPDFGAASIQ